MNTRQTIIEILGKEWPLSAKKIHNIIKKTYKKNITYHTMYEILQDLVIKKEVKKHEKVYFLNLEWIGNQIEQYEKILNSYNKNWPIRIINKQSTQITVYSLDELLSFILSKMKDNFFGSEYGGFFMICNHMWGSFYSKDEKDILRKYLDSNAHIICKNKTVLDKKISRFYSKLRAKIKLGVETSINYDLIMIGDCSLQIYYPVQFKKKLNEVFEMRNIIDLKKIRTIKQIFKETHKIEIIVIRNEQIANNNRKLILKEFNY